MTVWRFAAAGVSATQPVVAAHDAWAQRASENAVTQADDAFGTTIGNEKIGIYNEDDVRASRPSKPATPGSKGSISTYPVQVVRARSGKRGRNGRANKLQHPGQQ